MTRCIKHSAELRWSRGAARASSYNGFLGFEIFHALALIKFIIRGLYQQNNLGKYIRETKTRYGSCKLLIGIPWIFSEITVLVVITSIQVVWFSYFLFRFICQNWIISLWIEIVFIVLGIFPQNVFSICYLLLEETYFNRFLLMACGEVTATFDKSLKLSRSC